MRSQPQVAASAASGPGPHAGSLENPQFNVLEMARLAKQERAHREAAHASQPPSKFSEKSVSLSNMVREAKEKERRLKEARRELMMSGVLGTGATRQCKRRALRSRSCVCDVVRFGYALCRKVRCGASPTQIQPGAQRVVPLSKKLAIRLA